MQAPAKNPHREIGIQAASDFFKASISQQMRESVKPIFQGVTDDHVAFDIYEGYAGRTIIKTNGCRACRECRKNFDRARPRDAEYWRNYREQRKAVSHG